MDTCTFCFCSYCPQVNFSAGSWGEGVGRGSLRWPRGTLHIAAGCAKNARLWELSILSGLQQSAPKNQVTSCPPPKQQLLVVLANSPSSVLLSVLQTLWAHGTSWEPSTSPPQDLGGMETNTRVLKLLPRAVTRVTERLSVSGVSCLLQHPRSCQWADLFTCTFGKTLDVPKSYCLEKKLSRDHNPICQKIRFQCRRLLILK